MSSSSHEERLKHLLDADSDEEGEGVFTPSSSTFAQSPSKKNDMDLDNLLSSMKVSPASTAATTAQPQSSSAMNSQRSSLPSSSPSSTATSFPLPPDPSLSSLPATPVPPPPRAEEAGSGRFGNLAESFLQTSGSFLKNSSSLIQDAIRSTTRPISSSSSSTAAASTNQESGGGEGRTRAGSMGSLLSSLNSGILGSAPGAMSMGSSRKTSSAEGLLTDPEQAAASSSFPTNDFREVTDISKVSLWAYLSQTHPIRCIEIKIRPDVSKESILELFETIILSHGLVVTERGGQGQDGKSAFNGLIVERQQSESSGRWNTLSLQLGVNRTEKARILLMEFYADSKYKIKPSQVVPGAQSYSPDAGGPIGARLIKALGHSLLEAKMLLSTMAPDEDVVVKLDPWYVKDMQEMFAAEMMADLQAYAAPMDVHVKDQELRCAKLMTALQAVYARGELDISHPKRAKSLNSFPLEMSRASILDATLESIQQILSEVQSPYRKERISVVIERICQELSTWCEEERQARIARKKLQVLARLNNVTNHRGNLIKTLRDSAQIRQSSIDQQLHTAFRVAIDQSVLYDFSATYTSRPGRVYVTYGCMYFHSQILGFISQKVLPFMAIQSIESSTTPILGGTSVVIVDRGGERLNFLITNLNPPDLAMRVLDVMTQVLEVWRADHEAPPAQVVAGNDGDEAAVSSGNSSKGGVVAVDVPSSTTTTTHPSPQLARERGGSDGEMSPAQNKLSTSTSSTAAGPLSSFDDVFGGATTTTATTSHSNSTSSDGERRPSPIKGAGRGGQATITTDLLSGDLVEAKPSPTTTSNASLPRPRSLRKGIQAFLNESHGSGNYTTPSASGTTGSIHKGSPSTSSSSSSPLRSAIAPTEAARGSAPSPLLDLE